MACIYYLRIPGQEELRFDSKEAFMKHVRTNQLWEQMGNGERKYERTTKDLADALRQAKFGENNFHPQVLREFQESLLDEFLRLESQSQFFYNIGAAVSLTKGLGKSFDHIDNVKKRLGDLGINTEWNKEIPFDVRYLLTGDSKYLEDWNEDNKPYHHKITANNLRIVNEIDALSRTMFMERTPSFQYTAAKVVSNLKDNLLNDKVEEIHDELAAFSQIAAYKQWIALNDKRTSTLRNSLIYDTAGNVPTIVDIVKDAIQIAPDNTFLQFVLPVSTTVKVGKKKQINKIINRDLINTIEGKTRGRLEPDLIASMMDSFTELYNNPTTKFHAKALFDYLIIKDGLMFKNKSFIKLLPTIMFKEMSEATGIATKLMAANSEGEFKALLKELNGLDIIDKEGNSVDYFTETERVTFRDALKAKDLMKVRNMLFQKVFGFNYNDLYNKFESVYGTDVRNQFNLALIRTKVKIDPKKAAKSAEGISIAKVDDVNYLNVTMFPEKLNSFEKDTQERKDYFKQVVEELEEAGFPLATETEEAADTTKRYLNFKKFVRVREVNNTVTEDFFGGIVRGETTYTTYRLVSVERDKKVYSGASMTVDGEFIPRGTKAVYAPVKAVGTSNSTGVADVGTRPTKEEVVAALQSKIKGEVKKETPTQQKLFNVEQEKIKDHAMSYQMPASENIWGVNTTTLAEVESGRRTATTRSFALGKVGDIVTFEGRPQKYEIVAVEQLTKAKVESSEWKENWSKKEGWTVKHFDRVLGGSTVHIGSWQTTFRKVEESTGNPFGDVSAPDQQDLGSLLKDVSPADQFGEIGGMFSGLGQSSIDPNDIPFQDFSDEDVEKDPC
jgi:hypothetical protein